MNLSDLNALAHVALINPAQRSAAAATNGTGVDLQQYEGVLKAVVAVTVVSGTSPTADLKIQDSADNSTFADVSGLAITQVAGAGSSLQSIQIDTRLVRRYVRTVDTMGGTSPVVNVAAAIVGKKKTM